jgi:hypothetical protein
LFFLGVNSILRAFPCCLGAVTFDKGPRPSSTTVANTPLTIKPASITTTFFIMMEAIAAVVLIFGLISTGQIIHKANIWAKIRKRIQSSAVPTPNKEIPPFSPSQEIKPYQLPPLQIRTSTKMAMGLRRLDQANWLTIDSNYLPEHHLRKNFLATCRPKVIQCLLGSEAACHEVLGKVTKFLTGHFPQSFTLRNTSSGPVVDNHITGEIFPVGTKCPNPLETAALLAMEDFNVLIRNPETGEYHLQASATLFPAGWKLQERIGTTMANLHGPVPGWQEKMGAHVNRLVRLLTCHVDIVSNWNQIFRPPQL